VSLCLCVLFPAPALPIPLVNRGEFKIELGGYLQDLTTSAKDPFYQVDFVPTPLGAFPVATPGYSSDSTTRLRGQLRVLTGTPLSAEFDLDASYTFGSVLNSFLFQTAKALPPPTYFNWQRAYIDEDGRYGLLSVYRALVTWEAEHYRIVAGRQRLAYGTGLFWSPIDIWNPVSPLALEPEEKPGVDGISGIVWASEQLSFTALYGIGDTWDQSRLAVSASYRVKSYTFDLLAGKRMRDYVYGLDFVGYLGDAGVRGELTYTVADRAPDYPRAVIGIDYGFQNSLYLALEYYHNGGPFRIDPADPFAFLLTATGVDTLHRNFIGALASYDVNPLVKAAVAVIHDLDGGSEAFAPSLTWSASNPLTITVGGQFFRGAKNGEFGALPDRGWLRLRLDY
jgi:hypothetical protein